ncbi:hypothetical protein NLG97_g10860 [Lecanicillium saksenae]|uniref:Uncharacterized protein n=1 Tax=Lecanicillium saksenae TaxID=468837 RepID=A0ACC1QDC3_9HYPO|nr:hypothetical protein NLG97_g10860 [Lecanicillium saksenae]
MADLFVQDLENERKKRKLNEASQLCGQCSSLDFPSIFRTADMYFAKRREALKIPDPRGLFIHPFNDRLSHTSCCRLCRFFRSMRQHQGLSGADQAYSLMAFSSLSVEYSPTIGNTRAIADEACVAVVPTAAEPVSDCFWTSNNGNAGRVAYIYRTRKEVNEDVMGCWGREVSPNWNVEVAHEWMDFCRKFHRGNCRRKKLVRDSIIGFKVIDCHSAPWSVVEKGWAKEAYAALSYVWGQSQLSSTTDWPPVVKDAIQVTRDLGIRYLWVDRYCIDQKNADEVRQMIARMGSIYDEAELTIVAAAGSGSSHGLPGVGHTLRRPQPKLKIEETGGVLVSGLVSPKASVRDSAWSTRGWTCQEGYLSRKRLIFTDDQLYWECDGMCAGESKDIPLRMVHIAKGHRMQLFMDNL